jgi:hypothetical protein
MKSKKTGSVEAPPAPRVRLSIGVTGHRDSNAAFAANRTQIETALSRIFEAISAAVVAEPAHLGAQAAAPTRLHSMLVDGADQIAAELALAHGWELVAPLPFGTALNVAINASPSNPDDARALLAGADAADPVVSARARALREFSANARLFELADGDALLSEHYLAALAAPHDPALAQRFAGESSRRVALAAAVLIEQSDIIVGIWDGVTTSLVGGTGHTIERSLETGAPVVWVDPRAPERWRILRAPESLATLGASSSDDRDAALAALVRAALRPSGGTSSRHGAPDAGMPALDAERWRPRSDPLWHAYRRVEAMFGGEKGRSPFRRLRQSYESPDAIGAGSGAMLLAAVRALPGGDEDFAAKVEVDVLKRFAWSDGISARLSDTYRGGMTANFVLSAFAIIAGIAYLPFATSDEKAIFASVEFSLLAAILAITWLGQSRRWHGRWFETRRVAEYFRHSPILLALGVARPPGRWPKGTETSWPEWYARHGLRDVGLPRVAVTAAFLRVWLRDLLDGHVVSQRDYHFAKAKRLTNVHRNLDRLSEFSFQLAVVSVALFLALTVGVWASLVSATALHGATKTFTFLGVLLPTFGAAIAGIRYFGDFERFAAISEVTAEKLDAVHKRIEFLLAAPDAALDYGRAADLAHAADDIVVSEIENWQAVFGGKHITVPV